MKDEFVEVEMASGNKLTRAPNFPVLTNVGWKPLSAVKEGDNLIDSAFLKRMCLIADYFDQVVSRLNDKIASFQGRTATRPITAGNFHGDGLGSHVHTITTNSPLDPQRSTVLDKVEQCLFRRRVKLSAFLSSYGYHSVGCLNALKSFFGRYALSPFSLCFAAGSDFVSMRSQASSNTVWADSKLGPNLNRRKVIIAV
jgi:hypothetical protein